MIYFFRHRSGRIKIGHSNDPIRRLYDLENRLKCAIVPLAVMPGNRPEEQALHARFVASRVHGEWFDPTPGLLALIQAEAKPWPQLEPRHRGRNHPDPGCCYNLATLCWLLWADNIVELDVDSKLIVEVISEQTVRYANRIVLADDTIVGICKQSMIQPGPLGSTYRHVGRWDWHAHPTRCVLQLDYAILIAPSPDDIPW